jgi:hypothetical protein
MPLDKAAAKAFRHTTAWIQSHLRKSGPDRATGRSEEAGH